MRSFLPSAFRSLCACVVLLAAGCGYSLGPHFSEGVTSIAVPIFQNHTFPLRREVEYDLTELVRKEIQSHTSLTLASDESADMVVYGTVADFKERVITVGATPDQKAESTLFISINLLVEDRVNRRRSQENLPIQEPISQERGETLDQSRRRALERLAKRIVDLLESWDEPK